MYKIRTLIVDDEPLPREGIRLLLKNDTEIEIIGECATGMEALDIIQTQLPDLLFLDVQMPEINGFDLLAQLTVEKWPIIIFVTAYDRYAVAAFEAEAVDYLLKPFTDERFYKALTRAKLQLQQQSINLDNQRLLSLLTEYQQKEHKLNVSESLYLSRLLIKSAGKVFFLSTDEIDWIEAADYYVLLHVGSRSHLLRETISELEHKLDPAKFTRIHRSIIVNNERITEVQTNRAGDSLVILKDGSRLKLSRRRREKIKAFLLKFLA